MRDITGPDDLIATYVDARDDGSLTILREQDVEPILDHNQLLQNSGDGYTPSRDMVRFARIPIVLLEEWKKQGLDIFNENDWPIIHRLLLSSEHNKLRTSTKKL